jgi:uncharacterized membrane protein YfcA
VSPLFFLLFAAGLLGGALNSVAGGGSFITLPALLYAGIPPVAANATSTLALWPGTVSSAIAYRRDVHATLRGLLLLGAASLGGGLIGARLLLGTSDTSFMRLLPWLMLVAAATFTFGPRLVGRPSGSGRHGVSAGIVALQFVIAIYGGYFGGGMGIMMLAAFASSGMTDIHEMNALKTILGSTVNGIALAEFILKGVVMWTPGLVTVAGAIVGGYGGASLARHLDRRHVRTFVIVVGWAMTVYFFARGR